MMEYGDTVTMLRSIPIFARLDPAKLKLIAFASDYLAFDEGEALVHEGEPADCAFLIDEGTVDIFVKTVDAEVKVGSLGAHELFGEMAIFRKEPRSATIRATGPLKVLRIDGDMFVQVVTENPDTALAVMQILSEKIARATEREKELADEINMLRREQGGAA